MAFRLFSSAFAEGGWIPELHTCQRADISPSLEWMGEPPETRGYALTVDDPDAPGGVWTHWLLYDIPSQTHTLAQGYRTSGQVLAGANDFGNLGYGGPCPPRGHGAHRYFFKLYALDLQTLGLPAGVRAGELARALKGHILAEARYMGRFEQR